jgi:hypothetical protein
MNANKKRLTRWLLMTLDVIDSVTRRLYSNDQTAGRYACGWAGWPGECAAAGMRRLRLISVSVFLAKILLAKGENSVRENPCT